MRNCLLFDCRVDVFNSWSNNVPLILLYDVVTDSFHRHGEEVLPPITIVAAAKKKQVESRNTQDVMLVGGGDGGRRQPEPKWVKPDRRFTSEFKELSVRLMTLKVHNSSVRQPASERPLLAGQGFPP